MTRRAFLVSRCEIYCCRSNTRSTGISRLATRVSFPGLGGRLILKAVHIPRTVLEWRADPACDHCDARIADLEARLIIVCNDGYSSSLAAANLRLLGFRRVADLVGGYRAWVAAGLPSIEARRSV